MKKWIAGLLVSIIAGLIVWFLTQSSFSPFSRPEVELAGVNIPERVVAGKQFRVSFTATNKSSRTERDCQGFVSIWPKRDEENRSSGSDPRVRRAVASCETVNPAFYLGSLSGSSTEILVDCVVREPGTFRMMYGLSCRSGENSKWQLDHHTYIDVVEP